MNPDGTRQVRYFDPAGNLTSFQDEEGAVTTMERDERGLVQAITNAENRTPTLGHDACGDLITARDNLGQITSFERSSVGLELSRTTPGNRTLRTEYTGQALVTALVDGAGQRTTIDHDGIRDPRLRHPRCGHEGSEALPSGSPAPPRRVR